MKFPKFPTLPKIDLEGLKALPAIAFALMLGAGMVMTLMAAWLIVIIAYGKWVKTAEVDISRITQLGMFGLACLGIIGLVIVALAFGKVKSLTVSGSVVSGSVEFDDDDGPRHRGGDFHAPPNDPGC